ncbi:hypothetical protein RM844_00870 [Streptomyces sp. DSM 44915]|uniref:Uncharacterized protein n=1 Tax=Streptomyces chisholmiae TaxID=3075540 RepID=A0ABU2JIM2_9ACTN|nr:hypothetical protein [Streptomyces sp. DSM 44915]MDT0264835.1 hypothetical protein [Streptomyces sp. DSM 44915]
MAPPWYEVREVLFMINNFRPDLPATEPIRRVRELLVAAGR